jgi:dihydrofolate synthase/folylpolyglutamate synthase
MVNSLSEYSSAIDALFARTTSGTKFGLERTRELLEFLGNPERRFKSIHVAGTNGKGSVVAMCDAILREKGLKVGRYTSPHLIDFRERVLVNGEPISEADVLRFLERTTALSERIGATFFELTTALAFSHFAEAGVDIAVIETGLGGRLDSTNVLQPEVAVVTSIGLDHTDLLGDTLEKIAAEKAGIFKTGAPAIIGERASGVRQELEDAARAAGASDVITVTGSSDLRLSLAGAHQGHNAAIAIAAVGALPPDLRPNAAQIGQGLRKVFLPGRFQRAGKYLLDVAHNPDAAALLAKTIETATLPRPRVAVLAVLNDKDWRGVIRALAPEIDRFVLTLAPGTPRERAWDPAEAAAWCESNGFVAQLELDFVNAMASASLDSGTIIITGSFTTVGSAMKLLGVSPIEC